MGNTHDRPKFQALDQTVVFLFGLRVPLLCGRKLKASPDVLGPQKETQRTGIEGALQNSAINNI